MSKARSKQMKHKRERKVLKNLDVCPSHVGDTSALNWKDGLSRGDFGRQGSSNDEEGENPLAGLPEPMPTGTKIWVVFGTTGEYSDRSEWPVDAWKTEDAAKSRVTFLTTKMQELGITRRRYNNAENKAMEKMRAHDANFGMDYTGTSYYIVETYLK